MTGNEPYAHYDEVLEDLRRLQRIRLERREAVELYWQAIRDDETRGRLLKDALHDAFRSIRPMQAVSSFFAGNGTSAGTRIAAQALTGRGSIKRRLFWAIVSAAAPSLIGLASSAVGRFMRREPAGSNGEEILDR